MAVNLPPLFIDRMQQLLGSEYEAFLASYEAPRYAGIRVNTLKIGRDTFLECSPFSLRSVPWCETGFYIEDGMKPGKHPYYHAGLYYIQEPSAMSPAEALDVHPGDLVLDLCAAPGGKSTQLAAKLEGQGVLVTNDINSERTKALAKNIELYGVRNAVVLNESPDRIAAAFPSFFNKILIDAPCSGEGMFRKDEDMARQWEKHSVEKCSLMQREILQSAANMLAPGGRIVYSTCTFAPEEDEAQIARFLEENPDFEVVPLPDVWGISKGRADWISNPEFTDSLNLDSVQQEAAAQTANTGRLWPHLVEGEGHFVAVLQHTGGQDLELEVEQEQEQILRSHPPNPTQRQDKPARSKGRSLSQTHSVKGKAKAKADHVSSYTSLLEGWESFASDHLSKEFSALGEPVVFGSHIYLSPIRAEQLDGLKVVRPGWYVGSLKGTRFNPGHPLATALRVEEAARTLNLPTSESEVIRYLKGETLEVPQELVHCQDGVNPKGYVLVCTDGYSLGWGKWQDGMLKNEYPPGWRWT